MSRGKLTDNVKKFMENFLDRETSVQELRLIPYLQYVMLNEQTLDPSKINPEERAILSLWRKADYIEGGATELSITKEFWDFMNEVLWLAYVCDI